MSTLPATDAVLFADLRRLIDEARLRAAAAVNAELTLLHWRVGDRIHREILGSRCAGYSEKVVATLGRQLSAEYGRGFSAKSLRHMIRFAEVFPDSEIVSTLSRQLAWSHFLELIYLNDPLAREYLTVLPPREVLQAKLHQSIERAQLRFKKDNGDAHA